MGQDLTGENLFTDDRYCLCCGEKNPLGFKMKFQFVEKKILSETVVPKEYQGFADVVHGGILGTLLDELIVNLYWLKGEKVVTVEYQVRLKTPCPVNQKIFLSAWPVDAKGRLHYTAAEARLGDGTLVAEATAKCLKIK
jgi:acyl-coenzyme A thioesterase PaaI-like protein